MRACSCVNCLLQSRPEIIRARADYLKNLRLIDDMERLFEKLSLAAAIAPRQATKIEARADRLIAREADIERMTDEGFSPHEIVLDQAEAALDALPRALATLTNSDPLARSGASLNGSSPASDELAKHRGAGLLAETTETQAHD